MSRHDSFGNLEIEMGECSRLGVGEGLMSVGNVSVSLFTDFLRHEVQ